VVDNRAPGDRVAECFFGVNSIIVCSESVKVRICFTHSFPLFCARGEFRLRSSVEEMSNKYGRLQIIYYQTFPKPHPNFSSFFPNLSEGFRVLFKTNDK